MNEPRTSARGHHHDQPVVQGGVPLEEARAVAVLLHGRGASAESMLTLARNFDVEGLAYLAPQAYGHTWYPQSFLAPLAANEPALSSALHAVGQVVKRAEEAGVEAGRVALVGFSQGACLASEFAARHPRRYGGLIAFSGGLIGSDDVPGSDSGEKRFDYDGDLEGTPAFLGCSDVDAHIPVERVYTTAEVLTSLGADVSTHIYEGMGHTINNDEVQRARQMLQQIVH